MFYYTLTHHRCVSPDISGPHMTETEAKNNIKQKYKNISVNLMNSVLVTILAMNGDGTLDVIKKNLKLKEI